MQRCSYVRRRRPQPLFPPRPSFCASLSAFTGRSRTALFSISPPGLNPASTPSAASSAATSTTLPSPPPALSSASSMPSNRSPPTWESPPALGRHKLGKLALFLVLARVAHQGSSLSATRWARDHAVAEVLGVGSFDEDDLCARQDKTEKALWRNQLELVRRNHDCAWHPHSAGSGISVPKHGDTFLFQSRKKADYNCSCCQSSCSSLFLPSPPCLLNKKISPDCPVIGTGRKPSGFWPFAVTVTVSKSTL